MGRPTVEDCYSISTSFLRKHGYFKEVPCIKGGGISWSRCGKEVGSVSFSVNTLDMYIKFYYKSKPHYSDEDWKDKNYNVRFTTTPCNLEGVRFWFVCPFCYKRVGTLHLYGSNDFACRHCLDLSYDSRNHSKKYRFMGDLFKAEELQKKIWDLRVKYYKGKKTKRYRELLRRSEEAQKRFEMFAPDIDKFLRC